MSFQVDRQLACCRIQSDPGQRYLKAMKCAANFAFVNRYVFSKASLIRAIHKDAAECHFFRFVGRSLMAMGVRRAFAKVPVLNVMLI